MAEDRFGAIIVGAGLAGSTAALVLARAGVEVLVIERGNYGGAKNVTGGRLCGHSLERLFPDFPAGAPVERRISEKRCFSWTGDGAAALEIDPEGLGLSEDGAYSIQRGRFDSWLAEQAEEAGAMFVCGIRVDKLIVREGRVCGAVAGNEAMEADVVILAEGTNALLAQSLELRPELEGAATCVGVKEVIRLDPALIEGRLGLEPGQGAEWMFLGERHAGVYADGFLYTNQDSLSVGIQVRIADIPKLTVSVPELLEEFKGCDAIAPLLEGGRLEEYAAHLLPLGSFSPAQRLYGDGVLLTGDAGGLVNNLGFLVRGMDLAVESGRLAAQTVIEALERGDCSAGSLAPYQQAVEEGLIGQNRKACAAYLSDGNKRGYGHG